jgi:predicted phage terminase large subunit-like protein
VIALAGRHKPNRILVEDAGTGTALVAELRRHGVTIIGIRPEKDKVTRMSVQSAKFEAGLVHLPEQAPWLASFEVELFAFTGSRHGDQIDSVSKAPANGIRGTLSRTYVRAHCERHANSEYKF